LAWFFGRFGRIFTNLVFSAEFFGPFFGRVFFGRILAEFFADFGYKIPSWQIWVIAQLKLTKTA